MASASIHPTDPHGPSLTASPALRVNAGSRLPSRRGATSPSLDALPLAVLVVDGTGALHLANALARRLLFASGVLRVERGCLVAATRADTERLLDAIVRLTTTPGAGVREERLTLRATDGERELLVRVRREAVETAEPGSLGLAWVLIEDEDPVHAATDRLVARLTPRERDVLRLLLAGEGAKQIAWMLGLSTHTVAGYVKTLHRRLGVRSRGELLSRFVGRPAPEALGGLRTAATAGDTEQRN
jgi:DNA-binding CsgD family transcriptional regulator